MFGTSPYEQLGAGDGNPFPVRMVIFYNRESRKLHLQHVLGRQVLALLHRREFSAFDTVIQYNPDFLTYTHEKVYRKYNFLPEVQVNNRKCACCLLEVQGVYRKCVFCLPEVQDVNRK